MNKDIIILFKLSGKVERLNQLKKILAENVDNKKTLQSIISGLLNSKGSFLFPIHPRTVNRLKEFDLYKKIKNSNKIELIPSVGYFDMLYLMKKCTFIFTDSGGIQEEATSP